MNKQRPAPARQAEAPTPPVWFNEAGYLRLNPDVAKAVAQRDFASGYEHYVSHGRTEGRMLADI